MEQELSDPAPYYYTGGGQFYSTQLVRSLSETSQTSSQGTGGGPSGGAIAAPSGGGNGSFGSWLAGDEENNLENYFSFGNLGVSVGDSESGFIVPVGAIAEIVEQWISFFDWLFGGGGPPPTPRKLLHQRHPLYPVILGVSYSLIPDEVSAGKCQFCGDAQPCNVLELPTPTGTPTSPDLNEYMNNQEFETDEQMRLRLESYSWTPSQIDDYVAHRFANPLQITPYGWTGPTPTPNVWKPAAPLQKPSN